MGNGKDKLNGDYVILRPDKRKALRKHLLVLKITGERENVFFGYAKDISRGGLFISTVNPKPEGEEFTISFESPADKKKIKCRCKVMWSRQFDPETRQEAGMGIKFLDLDLEERRKIDLWVKKK